jgi:hypothetical protein
MGDSWAGIFSDQTRMRVAAPPALSPIGLGPYRKWACWRDGKQRLTRAFAEALAFRQDMQAQWRAVFM